MVLMYGWALTIDQRHSRISPDAVPRLLAALADLPVLDLGPEAPHPSGVDAPSQEPFRAPRWDLLPERTAGDEVQAFTADPATLVAATWTVCGVGRWWCGIGMGQVDTPLPSSTREATGTAYLAARDAVTAAKSSLGGMVVRSGPPSPTSPSAAATPCAQQVRFIRAMEVVSDLAGSTTPAVREVCALYDRGMTTARAAQQVGVSAAAISQRLTRARWSFLRRTRELAIDLATEALASVAAGSPQQSASPAERPSAGTAGRSS